MINMYGSSTAGRQYRNIQIFPNQFLQLLFLMCLLYVSNFEITASFQVASLPFTNSCFTEELSEKIAAAQQLGLVARGKYESECSFQVLSVSSNATLLDLYGPFHQVETIRNLFNYGRCSPKNKLNCTMSFFVDTINIHLSGHAEVLLLDISYATYNRQMCLRTGNQLQTILQDFGQQQCRRASDYDTVVICSAETIRCNLRCPPSCTCSLQNGDVISHCENAESKTHKGLLLLEPGMAYLDLHQNSLEYIDLKNLNLIKSQLQELIFTNNYLKSLNESIFDGLTQLLVLNVAHNELISLEVGLFDDLVQLKELNLFRNSLETLPVDVFRSLSNLRVLVLTNNNLIILETGLFKNLVHLEVLDIGRNNLMTLPVGVFRYLVKLEYLYLAYNSLSSLSAGIFDGLTQLRDLILHNNNLKILEDDIFNELQNLNSLSLEDNSLTLLAIGCLKGLYRIAHIHLNDNNISKLDIGLFLNMSSVTSLNFAGNRLQTLKSDIFIGLSGLKALYISNNLLSWLEKFAFSGLLSLTRLNLSQNNLEILQPGVFDGLSTLIHLELTSNKLHKLESGVLTGLNRLENLYINNNQLITIGHGAFRNLSNLQTLRLSDNRLVNLYISTDALVKLKNLDLSNNKLQELPSFGQMSRFETLKLTGNPLKRVNRRMFHYLPGSVTVMSDQPEICICYLPEAATNTCLSLLTNEVSPYLTCRRLLSDMPLVVFTWLFGLFALFGNVFVICWRKVQRQSEHQVQSILICNLAVSDLLMGIYMLILASADAYFVDFFPMYSTDWRLGAVCKLAGAVAISSSEASVILVTLISIDRFIRIKYPTTTRKLQPHSTYITLVFVWIFVCVVALIPSILSGKNPNFYDHSHVCIGLPLAQKITFSTKSSLIEYKGIAAGDIVMESVKAKIRQVDRPGMYFSTCLFLGFNLVCFVIVAVCYEEIIRTVCRSSRRARRSKEMNKEIRLAIKVAAIVATDFLCWFPIIVTGVLVQFGVVKLPPKVFVWTVIFILPINSALNPYLYTLATVVGAYLERKKQKQNNQQTGRGISTQNHKLLPVGSEMNLNTVQSQCLQDTSEAIGKA